MLPLERLKKRSDFLACAATGHKWVRPAFVLQVNPATASESPRLGFTTTKKLGNAVVRNRIRRRLREAARLSLPNHTLPHHDYVLIGRPDAAGIDLTQLQNEMAEGMRKIHRILAQKAKEAP